MCSKGHKHKARARGDNRRMTGNINIFICSETLGGDVTEAESTLSMLSGRGNKCANKNRKSCYYKRSSLRECAGTDESSGPYPNKNALDQSDLWLKNARKKQNKGVTYNLCNMDEDSEDRCTCKYKRKTSKEKTKNKSTKIDKKDKTKSKCKGKSKGSSKNKSEKDAYENKEKKEGSSFFSKIINLMKSKKDETECEESKDKGTCISDCPELCKRSNKSKKAKKKSKRKCKSPGMIKKHGSNFNQKTFNSLYKSNTQVNEEKIEVRLDTKTDCLQDPNYNNKTCNQSKADEQVSQYKEIAKNHHRSYGEEKVDETRRESCGQNRSKSWLFGREIQNESCCCLEISNKRCGCKCSSNDLHSHSKENYKFVEENCTCDRKLTIDSDCDKETGLQFCSFCLYPSNSCVCRKRFSRYQSSDCKMKNNEANIEDNRRFHANKSCGSLNLRYRKSEVFPEINKESRSQFCKSMQFFRCQEAEAECLRGGRQIEVKRFY